MKPGLPAPAAIRRVAPRARLLKSSCVCARRRGLEELRVVLFLEEHGHEPILEPQFPGAEDRGRGICPPSACAGLRAWHRPRGHRRASAVVKRLDETARRLDQHAVAHGHHGGHADLQQLRGDGLGGLFGLRRLAGFEEDERDAVIASAAGRVRW